MVLQLNRETRLAPGFYIPPPPPGPPQRLRWDGSWEHPKPSQIPIPFLPPVLPPLYPHGLLGIEPPFWPLKLLLFEGRKGWGVWLPPQNRLLIFEFVGWKPLCTGRYPWWMMDL